MPLRLGAIADDLTGATDLALTLLDDAIANDDLGRLERGVDIATRHGPVKGDISRRVSV